MPEWVFCHQEGSFVDDQRLRQREFFPLLERAKLPHLVSTT
jgi:hypothetical protein